ncbi:hypothetical protein ACH4LE_22630 [Streptomyces sp. NPDC017413]|uniref:hypothetical protein n=1 Tax=Streptomyces sp. NPDC017413 TaxID=3364994 RepID=UPI003796DEC6
MGPLWRHLHGGPRRNPGRTSEHAGTTARHPPGAYAGTTARHPPGAYAGTPGRRAGALSDARAPVTGGFGFVQEWSVRERAQSP